MTGEADALGGEEGGEQRGEEGGMADGGIERRRYRFQTALPETMVEDLRASGLRLVGVSIGLGDAYGLYAVELVASGSDAALDAAEATWGLTPDVCESGAWRVSAVDVR